MMLLFASSDAETLVCMSKDIGKTAKSDLAMKMTMPTAHEQCNMISKKQKISSKPISLARGV